MSTPTRPVWMLPATGAALATTASLIGGINVDDPNVVPSVKAKKLLRTLVLGAAAGLGAEAMLRGGGIAYRGLMSKSSSAEQIKRFRNKTLYSLIKQGAEGDIPGIPTVPESPMVPTTTPETPPIPGNPVTNVAEAEKPATPTPTETNTTPPTTTNTPPKQDDKLPWHRQSPLGIPNGYIGYGLGTLAGAGLLYHFLTEKKKRKPNGYLNSMGAGLLAGLLGYGLYDLSQGGFGTNKTTNKKQPGATPVPKANIPPKGDAARLAYDAKNLQDSAMSQANGLNRAKPAINWNLPGLTGNTSAIKQVLDNVYYSNDRLLEQATNGPTALQTFPATNSAGKADQYQADPEAFVNSFKNKGRQELTAAIEQALIANNVQGNITNITNGLVDQMLQQYNAPEQLQTRAIRFSKGVTQLASTISSMPSPNTYSTQGIQAGNARQAAFNNYVNRQATLLSQQLGRDLTSDEKNTLATLTGNLINAINDRKAINNEIQAESRYLPSGWKDNFWNWQGSKIQALGEVVYRYFHPDMTTPDADFSLAPFTDSPDKYRSVNDLKSINNASIQTANTKIADIQTQLQNFYAELVYPSMGQQIPGTTSEESAHLWGTDPGLTAQIQQALSPESKQKAEVEAWINSKVGNPASNRIDDDPLINAVWGTPVVSTSSESASPEAASTPASSTAGAETSEIVNSLAIPESFNQNRTYILGGDNSIPGPEVYDDETGKLLKWPPQPLDPDSEGYLNNVHTALSNSGYNAQGATLTPYGDGTVGIHFTDGMPDIVIDANGRYPAVNELVDESKGYPYLNRFNSINDEVLLYYGKITKQDLLKNPPYIHSTGTVEYSGVNKDGEIVSIKFTPDGLEHFGFSVGGQWIGSASPYKSFSNTEDNSVNNGETEPFIPLSKEEEAIVTTPETNVKGTSADEYNNEYTVRKEDIEERNQNKVYLGTKLKEGGLVGDMQLLPSTIINFKLNPDSIVNAKEDPKRSNDYFAVFPASFLDGQNGVIYINRITGSGDLYGGPFPHGVRLVSGYPFQNTERTTTPETNPEEQLNPEVINVDQYINPLGTTEANPGEQFTVSDDSGITTGQLLTALGIGAGTAGTVATVAGLTPTIYSPEQLKDPSSLSKFKTILTTDGYIPEEFSSQELTDFVNGRISATDLVDPIYSEREKAILNATHDITADGRLVINNEKTRDTASKIIAEIDKQIAPLEEIEKQSMIAGNKVDSKVEAQLQKLRDQRLVWEKLSLAGTTAGTLDPKSVIQASEEDLMAAIRETYGTTAKESTVQNAVKRLKGKLSYIDELGLGTERTWKLKRQARLEFLVDINKAYNELGVSSENSIYKHWLDHFNKNELGSATWYESGYPDELKALENDPRAEKILYKERPEGITFEEAVRFNNDPKLATAYRDLQTAQENSKLIQAKIDWEKPDPEDVKALERAIKQEEAAKKVYKKALVGHTYGKVYGDTLAGEFSAYPYDPDRDLDSLKKAVNKARTLNPNRAITAELPPEYAGYNGASEINNKRRILDNTIDLFGDDLKHPEVQRAYNEYKTAVSDVIKQHANNLSEFQFTPGHPSGKINNPAWEELNKLLNSKDPYIRSIAKDTIAELSKTGLTPGRIPPVKSPIGKPNVVLTNARTPSKLLSKALNGIVKGVGGIGAVDLFSQGMNDAVTPQTNNNANKFTELVDAQSWAERRAQDVRNAAIAQGKSNEEADAEAAQALINASVIGGVGGLVNRFPKLLADLINAPTHIYNLGEEGASRLGLKDDKLSVSDTDKISLYNLFGGDIKGSWGQAFNSLKGVGNVFPVVGNTAKHIITRPFEVINNATDKVLDNTPTIDPVKAKSHQDNLQYKTFIDLWKQQAITKGYSPDDLDPGLGASPNMINDTIRLRKELGYVPANDWKNMSSEDKEIAIISVLPKQEQNRKLKENEEAIAILDKKKNDLIATSRVYQRNNPGAKTESNPYTAGITRVNNKIDYLKRMNKAILHSQNYGFKEVPQTYAVNPSDVTPELLEKAVRLANADPVSRRINMLQLPEKDQITMYNLIKSINPKTDILPLK